jgi:CubicO group peptidase (beta-lactamase class C family)
MEKTLKDWNAPGIGVGIVVGDKLVFAKGYGYRDYEKKLPITAQTLYPNRVQHKTVHGDGRGHVG